jgi:hypothetical protein
MGACSACILLASAASLPSLLTAQGCLGAYRPKRSPFCAPPRDAGALGDTSGAQTSEQWLLGRDAVPPGEALRARLPLAQNAVFEFLVNDFSRLQPELPQWFRGPPLTVAGFRLGTWGFGHQEPRTHFKEGSGALGQHRRTPEGTGQRPVEPGPQVRVAPGYLGALLEYRDTVLEIQTLDRPAQEGGSTAIGLQQRHGDVSPLDGHDQSGKTATRAEVHQAGGARPGQATGDGGEALRMADLQIQRTRPQKAQGARLEQELLQRNRGVTPFVGAGHRRRVSLRAR